MADLPNETETDNSFLKCPTSDAVVTIQTHDKRFHANDVGAVSLLTCYFNSKNVKIHLIRSRNTELFQTSDILVDVGGIYSPESGRFDHHQENCNETYSLKSSIPMGCIGMIWKHFGKEILTLYLEGNNLNQMKDQVDELCQEIYSKIIQEIDAHDNGILMVEGGKRNFRLNMDITSIISSMNSDDTSNETNQLAAFGEAVSLFGKIFEIRLKDVIRKFYSYKINQDKVTSLLNSIPKDSRQGSEYLVIDEKIDSIYKLLNFLDPSFKIKFLIFTDTPGEVTIKTRSRPENIYQPIVPLLSEEKIKNDDLIFVHKGLFMAKTKNIDSAVKIVNMSLKARMDEEVPSSYLNAKISRVSTEWMKLGGIGIFLLSGALLYKKFSD